MEVSDTIWDNGETVYYYIKNIDNYIFKKSSISSVTITIEGEYKSETTVYKMYNGDDVNESRIYDTPKKLYDAISSRIFSTVLDLDKKSDVTIKL